MTDNGIIKKGNATDLIGRSARARSFLAHPLNTVKIQGKDHNSSRYSFKGSHPGRGFRITLDGRGKTKAETFAGDFYLVIQCL
jgi:hypothetical protein